METLHKLLPARALQVGTIKLSMHLFEIIVNVAGTHIYTKYIVAPTIQTISELSRFNYFGTLLELFRSFRKGGLWLNQNPGLLCTPFVDFPCWGLVVCWSNLNVFTSFCVLGILGVKSVQIMILCKQECSRSKIPMV